MAKPTLGNSIVCKTGSPTFFCFAHEPHSFTGWGSLVQRIPLGITLVSNRTSSSLASHPTPASIFNAGFVPAQSSRWAMRGRHIEM
ncbi:hypothetical protein XELAEV_18013598mg [Xenopus laevis]|uniref:Uncharacterized protein n=1 Tax=Xenopus laevis TaxID=8355 RepID=A0A974DPQ3_XENLA|nr:hypothetical protein XELAEV_18013598mg [Xenopus laevis]